MNGGTADFDGYDRVEGPDGRLEGLEIPVFVWEHTEMTSVHPKADTGVDVLL